MRLRNERRLLEHRLEVVLSGRPEILGFRFAGLATLTAYRALAPEGLVHATVTYARGCVTVVAATSRFMRKPELRQRLFAIRRIAEARGQRIVLLTTRGLEHRMIQCRVTRVAPSQTNDLPAFLAAHRI